MLPLDVVETVTELPAPLPVFRVPVATRRLGALFRLRSRYVLAPVLAFCHRPVQKPTAIELAGTVGKDKPVTAGELDVFVVLCVDERTLKAEPLPLPFATQSFPAGVNT
jgi:hypothetical protein